MDNAIIRWAINLGQMLGSQQWKCPDCEKHLQVGAVEFDEDGFPQVSFKCNCCSFETFEVYDQEKAGIKVD